MRNIDSIIVHCSATKVGQDFTVADIDRWHRERGFNGIGYHYVIRLDGRLEKGRDVSLIGAHCKGWNERSIGICYVGGLNENGQPADTGVIKPYEYMKACPCFDVGEFLRSGRELLFVLLVVLAVPGLLSGCRSKREVVNRREEIKVDSSFEICSGKNVEEQAFISRRDSDMMEEHMERLVIVFPYMVNS